MEEIFPQVRISFEVDEDRRPLAALIHNVLDTFNHRSPSKVIFGLYRRDRFDLRKGSWPLASGRGLRATRPERGVQRLGWSALKPSCQRLVSSESCSFRRH